MYRYIGIEDLVASALIEMMKPEENIRRVSLQSLTNYGAVIVKLLSRSGQDAILFLSKESTYAFVHDYADCFSIVKEADVEYIESSVSVFELRRRFRKNLTVDLAKALSESESVSALRA